MQRVPVSAFIIAFNEHGRIGRTIEAIRDFCDEVIVVDSGSTDGTDVLAEALGARVLRREWPGYGAQKVFAQAQCRNDWVINVDADEVVSPALATEIAREFQQGEPDADAYVLKIADVVPGEDAPRRFAYTYRRVRLYRKSVGQFSSSPVHDVVQLESGARCRSLSGLVHHHSMRDVGQELAKFNAYTSAQVEDMRARGKSPAAWRLWTEFALAFVKAYVFRRYCFEGRYGFIRAMNYAFFRHLRLAKFFESQRGQSTSGRGRPI